MSTGVKGCASVTGAQGCAGSTGWGSCAPPPPPIGNCGCWYKACCTYTCPVVSMGVVIAPGFWGPVAVHDGPLCMTDEQAIAKGWIATDWRPVVMGECGTTAGDNLNCKYIKIWKTATCTCDGVSEPGPDVCPSAGGVDLPAAPTDEPAGCCPGVCLCKVCGCCFSLTSRVLLEIIDITCDDATIPDPKYVGVTKTLNYAFCAGAGVPPTAYAGWGLVEGDITYNAQVVSDNCSGDNTSDVSWMVGETSSAIPPGPRDAGLHLNNSTPLVGNCHGASGVGRGVYYDVSTAMPHACDVNFILTVLNNNCCRSGDASCASGLPDNDGHCLVGP